MDKKTLLRLRTFFIFGGLVLGFVVSKQSYSQTAAIRGGRIDVVAAAQVLTDTTSIFMPLVVNSLDETTEGNAVAAWKANTTYTVGNQVTYNGNIYQCRQAHTAQIGWEPPNTPALWLLVTSGATPTRTPTSALTTPTRTATPVPATATRTPTATSTAVNPTPTSATGQAWVPNKTYAVGTQVTHNGSSYRCLQAHTSQSGWEPPNAPALWQLITSGATSTPTATATSTPTAAGPTITPTMTPTGSTPTPGPTSAAGWPNRVFAPYVDVMLWPTFALAQTATTTGQKYYTLGFIISGGGCTAAWGGVTPLSQNFLLDDINNLRTQGGNVVISFGGASGMELGQACTTVATLQAQYQAVIDKYSFTALDFDVEGGASADMASITRRNQAIAGLQAAAISAGKSLKISYTLPVLPTGLTSDGINLLNNAIANGVKISVVNIMAMDYGSVAPPNQMGANAIQAANSLFGQLKPLYPAKTDAQRWAMLGVTPMIGLNDVSPEVFTLSDAQALRTFAQQKNIALLAMWSSTRDQQCPGNPSVSATCSGVTQAPWAFTNSFKPFTQ